MAMTFATKTFVFAASVLANFSIKFLNSPWLGLKILIAAHQNFKPAKRLKF
jgi:hypothetical protein